MSELETAFDRQSLEALKTLGKTLGQMTLYKIGHPTVAATLKIAEEHLTLALAATQGELLYSFDEDKLIANGRIVGSKGGVPNSITTLFTRFKISSVTFKAGLGNAELAAFCELASMRPDAPEARDPRVYLEKKAVTHIVFSEAVYAKMGEEALNRALEQRSIEEIIQALVGNAVADPAKQKLVYEKVSELLQEDIMRRVDEVTKPLVKERDKLQNEQSRTQSVISNMVEGVVMVDEQGKILMMNPAAEQVYGVSLAEVAGMHLAERAGEEHIVTLASEIQTPDDRPIKSEVEVKGDSDTMKTVRSAGAVVQNQDGKVVGMVSSLTDVAKHKELQRMQRDFIAHVTHELRAPLSSIRAALEILQGEIGGRIKEEENRVLGAALKNSDRLADLINSILDFSKIESGQMTVHPSREEPEKIGKEAVDALSAWAAKKKVNLGYECPGGLPPIDADKQRTVQVLINLLSNAIKFTPVGGRITVRVVESRERVSGGGAFVEFSVSDTGEGIDKADQKKIFEKFVQIAAGELHVGGTGLGLAIAKALVHLQGGKMWVESALGKGATFFFTVPVHVDRDGARAAAPVVQETAWWKKLLGLK